MIIVCGLPYLQGALVALLLMKESDQMKESSSANKTG